MKKIYILIFLALVCIVASGCGECDKEGETACSDGKLYQCFYLGVGVFGKNKWVEKLDCNEFDATCVKGNYQSQLPPEQSHGHTHFSMDKRTYVYPSPFEKYDYKNTPGSVWNHMCLSDVHECTGTGHLECTEDNQAIVNCEHSPEGPVPVIIATIPIPSFYGYTECVEGENGLSFAFRQGTCEEDEYQCYEEREFTKCSSNGFWHDLYECYEGTTCYQVNEKEIECR